MPPPSLQPAFHHNGRADHQKHLAHQLHPQTCSARQQSVTVHATHSLHFVTDTLHFSRFDAKNSGKSRICHELYVHMGLGHEWCMQFATLRGHGQRWTRRDLLLSRQLNTRCSSRVMLHLMGLYSRDESWLLQCQNAQSNAQVTMTWQHHTTGCSPCCIVIKSRFGPSWD